MTHAGHFPLDVLKELFLSTQETRMLELGVIPLRLDQATLLNVDYFSEAICVYGSGGVLFEGQGPDLQQPSHDLGQARGLLENCTRF